MMHVGPVCCVQPNIEMKRLEKNEKAYSNHIEIEMSKGLIDRGTGRAGIMRW